MDECIIVLLIIFALVTVGLILYFCKNWCKNETFMSNKNKNQNQKQNKNKKQKSVLNCPSSNFVALSPELAYSPNPSSNEYKNGYNYGVHDSKITKKVNGKIVGGCGPGCVYQCDSKDKCPNYSNVEEVNVNFGCGCGCEKFIENLPLGNGGTIFTYDKGDCSSNVNGVNKKVYKNPYGKTFDGASNNQMYGMCEEGSNNAFDEPYVKN